MRNISRRRFLGNSAAVAAGITLLPAAGKLFAQQSPPSKSDLVKVTNGSFRQLVESALKSLGGMERFIASGDRVVVKPNIGWDRRPEQAANTHPEVVARVIEACLEAGAKEVQVFDNTCNSAKRCYDNSGIAEAAEKAGAKVSFIMKDFFRKVKIKDGLMLKEWEFYRPALEADKYINLPILKQHGLARVTVGMKNIMGVIGGNRGAIHNNFDAKIADLNTVIKPALIIVDATRILRRNGPQGGSLSDVENPRSLIAGTDPVAVDAAAADLFGVPHLQLGFIHNAIKLGIGSLEGLKYMKTIDLQT